MNFVARTIIVVECEGRQGECQAVQQVDFDIRKVHLNEKVKGLIDYAFWDVKKDGWWVKPETSQAFCPGCAKKILELSPHAVTETEPVTLN